MSAFSVINFVTTLASAILLPFMGSIVDCLKWIKVSLVMESGRKINDRLFRNILG